MKRTSRTRRFNCLLVVVAVLVAAAFGSAAFAQWNPSAGPMPSMWSSPHGERPLSFAEWHAKQAPVATVYDCIYTTPPPPGPLPGPVGLVDIFVNSDLYPLVQTGVTQYIADVEAGGYTVNLFNGTWADPVALRGQLQSNQSAGLVGCVLIGDLPTAWYEMTEPESWGGAHVEFPIDLFYGDLDGSWADGDTDGIYDDHLGAMAPEIWVGRLAAYTLTWDNEAGLVNNYFAKNHAYRSTGPYCQNRALVYVDDDWEGWASQWSSDLGLAYTTRTVVSDKNATIATDYEDRLTHDYEWISVFAHSWPGGHHFKTETGDGGYTYNSEIRTIDPTALFYNLYACSAARFVESNYIAGWYVFVDLHGLAAISTTKTGSMLNFDDFYGPLGSAQTIGDAFRQWQVLNNENGVGADSRAWFYGMTIIGDPTLAPREHRLCVTADSPIPPVVASGGGATLSATYADNMGHAVATWSWDDGDAGGVFSPSAAVQSPTYTAPANISGSDITVTLTVSATCAGAAPLSDSDSTSLTVQPAAGHTLWVSAGCVPATVASGGTTACSATAGDSQGHGVAWSWSDGGAGGVFSPSALVQNPSYSAPLNYGASDISVMLTVTATCDGPSPLVDSDATTLTVQPAAVVFADVPASHPFRRFIEAIYREGITGGCGTDPLRFCPTGEVTRGQMAAFLCRAAGKTWLDRPSPTFTDVPRTHPLYGWIERLADAASWGGAPPTSGCGSGIYCPSAVTTRGQMAVFLSKAAGKAWLDKGAASFGDMPRGANGQWDGGGGGGLDADGTHTFYGWVERLADPGSWTVPPTTGCAPGPPALYCPGTNVTRAQMAVFLCRAFDVPY